MSHFAERTVVSNFFVLSFYRKGKRKKSEQEANMEIQVNGKKMELEQAVTLEELVTMLKHDKRQIAAEVNLEIIEKDKYIFRSQIIKRSFAVTRIYKCQIAELRVEFGICQHL